MTEPAEDSIAQHDHGPLNELEESLVAVLSGRMEKDKFLQIFLTSPVFLLLDGEIEGDTLGERRPLVFAADLGLPRMLAVFSHPDRTKVIRRQFQEYSHLLQVDCSWAFQIIGPTLGVALNPGFELGFELAPEGAQQIRQALAEQSASG